MNMNEKIVKNRKIKSYFNNFNYFQNDMKKELADSQKKDSNTIEQLKQIVI